MWNSIAKFILKYRIILIIFLVISTAFMAWNARSLEIQQEFASVIPQDHPEYIRYKAFSDRFGEDANVMILGFNEKDVFEQDIFQDWYHLSDRIKSVNGVDDILDVGHIPVLSKETIGKKFISKPLYDGKTILSDNDLDSVKNLFLSLPIYEGLIYNPETKTVLTAIVLDKEKMRSIGKKKIVKEIIGITDSFFAEKHDIQIRYSGIPYITVIKAEKVTKELSIFLGLALLSVMIILFVLFRSASAVIFPITVVITGVIWSVGTMALLGYKVTLLTGLIPSLIVVIGIPNCVYLLNKYHLEYQKHGSKLTALTKVIERIGIVTFFTNFTTAVGFGVFAFSGANILEEFGIVAGLNIAATFLISLILIPVVFSFLPPPKSKNTKYLQAPILTYIVKKLLKFTFLYRRLVYIFTFSIVALCAIGLFNLKARGYILDDTKDTASEYQDLKFFEHHFKGALPLDIIFDSGKKNGVKKLSALKAIDKIEKICLENEFISKPMSINSGIKYATQAYYNGNPKKYKLPTSFDQNFVLSYLQRSRNQTSDNSLLDNMTDSTGQFARIHMSVADIGSRDLPILIDSLKQDIYNEIDTSKYNLTFTGASAVALAGYRYLVDGLIYSLGLAIFVISLIMMYLFKSVRILFICLITNFIPLIFTAGIMGYFDIFLKPSTILVFSISFGIAVDDSIHFLAKFRQELPRNKWKKKGALRVTIQETGVSMIYTSIILFFGFIIFIASSFKGTIYLGVLTSLSLTIALLSNLILLPALLMTFYKDKNTK